MCHMRRRIHIYRSGMVPLVIAHHVAVHQGQRIKEVLGLLFNFVNVLTCHMRRRIHVSYEEEDTMRRRIHVLTRLVG